MKKAIEVNVVFLLTSFSRLKCMLVSLSFPECIVCLGLSYIHLRPFEDAYVFQVYQEGLRFKGILDEERRSELIPAVLDALLDFHINLLRKLRDKRLEAVVVDSISEIIYSEVC